VLVYEHKAIQKLKLDNTKLAKRFRKHLYQLDKKDKKTRKKHKILFESLETIAHPINRKELKKRYNSPNYWTISMMAKNIVV